MKKILSILVVSFVLIGFSKAKEVKITNELIYQKLIEIDKRLTDLEKRQAVLEAKFDEFKYYVEKRFDIIDKRFEDINRRFEDMNRRFEDINKRFEQLYTFLWIITGIFTTLTLGIIGFAYWDRRTIIRKAKEETIEQLEREGKLRNLIDALRELAKEDKKLAEVLKHYNLL